MASFAQRLMRSSLPGFSIEAGAISKIIDESNLVSLLFGIEPGDLLQHPLGVFQNTRIEQTEILKMLVAINDRLGKTALEPQRLQSVFDKWWPDFEARIAEWKTPEETTAPANKGSASDTPLLEKLHGQISDLIQLNQDMARSLAAPDKLLPPQYLRTIFQRINSETNFARNNLRHLADITREIDILVSHGAWGNKHQQMHCRKLMRDLNMSIEELFEFGTINRKRRQKLRHSVGPTATINPGIAIEPDLDPRPRNSD